MKKRQLFFLLVFCISAMAAFMTNCYAAKLDKKATLSNIQGYIDGLPIPCYKIDNDYYIIAEDLAQYGFDVRFYGAKEKQKPMLKIDYFFNDEHNTCTEEELTPHTEASFDLYESDIVTTINNNEVDSYNIGGMTMIRMLSLDFCGITSYRIEEKKISFRPKKSWSFDLDTGEAGNDLKSISSFDITMSKNEMEELEMTGENKQYLRSCALRYEQNKLYFGFSFNLRTIPPADALIDVLDSILTRERAGDLPEQLQSADMANKRIQVYLNGEKINITDIIRGRGNGHIDYDIYFDTDIQNFHKIQSLRIVCQ